MGNKASLGAGNVDIELDGEPYVLKPTLRAARAISQTHEGFIAAIDKAGRLELDTYIQVITLGVNDTGPKAKDIPEMVWRSGLPSLTSAVIEYLSILANGGRRQERDGGEEEENPQSE